jgi:hypothetical protein
VDVQGGESMGSLQATEFANMGIDPVAAMGWHLTSNHFPPLPASLIPVALEVVDRLANDPDDPGTVDLPEGVFYRDESEAPLWACAEAWHLGAFIDAALIEDGDLDPEDEDY